MPHPIALIGLAGAAAYFLFGKRPKTFSTTIAGLAEDNSWTGLIKGDKVRVLTEEDPAIHWSAKWDFTGDEDPFAVSITKVGDRKVITIKGLRRGPYEGRFVLTAFSDMEQKAVGSVEVFVQVEH